jgi:protein-L-isoaspartate O-methyltransferase
VAPVEERGEQRLALLRKRGDELLVTRLDRVRFVPLRS